MTVTTSDRFKDAVAFVREWSLRHPDALPVAAISILAGALRLPALVSVPGYFADEVYAAVDARSVLISDEHFTGASVGLLARLIPMIDGRNLAAGLIGTDVGDLRVVSALFGIGAAVVAFYLARDLFGREAGIAAGLILAVMPWAIYVSRIFLPASEILFLLLLTILLTLRAIRGPSIAAAIGAAATAVLCFYIYPASFITIPSFIATIFVFEWARIRALPARHIAAYCITGVLLILPLAIGHFEGKDRSIEEAQTASAEKLIWNQDLSFAGMSGKAASSWGSYFTPDYLLTSGDPNVRHSVQSKGQVGWIIVMLGVIGIIIIVRVRDRTHLMVGSWLLLFPLADALTYYDSVGNSIRAVGGAGVWALVAGLGFAWVLRELRVAIAVAIVVLLAVETALFATTYFGSYTERYAYAFESGYERTVEVLQEERLAGIPITLHAGYRRNTMLEYFSDYEVSAAQSIEACEPLPRDVARFTVLPRLFIVREDKDYASVEGCVERNLIERDLAVLDRVPRSKTQVVERFNLGSSRRFEMAILLVTRDKTRVSRKT